MYDYSFDIDDTGTPVVIDLGSHSIRVGFCNEELPSSDIPAVVGSMLDGTESAAHTDRIKEDIKYYMGTNQLRIPRKGMEIKKIMHNGMIHDWDAFENLMDYVYSKCLCTESMRQPVLITEAPWNTTENREKLMELMYEKYLVPACMICKNAAAAAFSCDIQNGIVIDSGATHTSAIPLYNGSVVTTAVVSSPMGGDFILKGCEKYLNENNINVIPQYLISHKYQVKAKQAPRWRKKNYLPKVTNSWHNYMYNSVLEDFKNNVLEIPEYRYNDYKLSKLPTCHYEFPNGYNQKFGIERYKIPEFLFNPSNESNLTSLSGIVNLSAEKCCDTVKDKLYDNIIITGGNAAMKSFPRRTQREIYTPNSRNPEIQSKRFRLISPQHTKRRFGPWIGGSLFASNRKFNRWWFSSNDFYERGGDEIETNFFVF